MNDHRLANEVSLTGKKSGLAFKGNHAAGSDLFMDSRSFLPKVGGIILFCNFYCVNKIIYEA